VSAAERVGACVWGTQLLHAAGQLRLGRYCHHMLASSTGNVLVAVGPFGLSTVWPMDIRNMPNSLPPPLSDPAPGEVRGCNGVLMSSDTLFHVSDDGDVSADGGQR